MWQKQQVCSKHKRDPDPTSTEATRDVDDFPKKDARATTLAKEGQLAKACAALLDELPATFSATVAQEMHECHQALAVPVSLAALFSILLVQEAQLSVARLDKWTVGTSPATHQRSPHPGILSEGLWPNGQ